MATHSDQLSDFKVTKITSSNFLKPLRVQFKINKINKNWDFLQVHDSVSILIYNKSRNVVVLVRQFRPSTYVGRIPKLCEGVEIDTNEYPVSGGYTLELCAGLVDKDLPVEQVACEELFEECGYQVPASRMKKIFSFRGVGVIGNISHLFYAEVYDTEKVADGGGLRSEGEFIEIVEMSVADFRVYIDSVDLMSPTGLATAALWFFANVDTSKLP